MKTKLFFLANILTISFLFSQTTAIPDSNFEQALINWGHDTNGMTGDILNSDAAAVINLDVSYSSISNLAGIEAFTNIQYLSIYGNSITTLSLTNNLQLKGLYADDNGMSSLDITQNILLEELLIPQNSFTSIDISQNTALKMLALIECYFLTSLDITNHVALEELYITSTALASIDLSQNTALTKFVCRWTPLTSIDLSACPSLYVADCVGNNLSELSVKNGNNHNMTNANFGSYLNPNLTCIEVDDVAYSDANWTTIDAQHYFSTNCGLGLEETESKNIEIYPNPVVDYVTLDINNDADYSLYNLQGKLIKKGHLSIGQNMLKLDDMPIGIYILNVKSQSSDFSKKLIKL